MVMAWVSLKFNDFGKFKLYQGLTVLCGLTFLVVKAFEYYGKFQHGHRPSTHTFYAIYFTLTGLHALHVLGGMGVNGCLWGPGARMWAADPERFTNRVEVAGLFWHFVDLVWIFLFPVLYLL
jgi:cytochrome c oxidase subunit 3